MCGAGASVPAGASQIAGCNPATSDCLRRVTVPVADFPNAVCNDGSPGVFYVRPGSGADVTKWIVHVQGGGSCSSHTACLERWCGQQGNLPYQANKMSTDWNADGVIDLPLNGAAAGMTSDDPANAFREWTHVWMYYCSSDSWLGRGSDVDYADPAGAGNDFSIDHRGHTILSAARRMLRKENANPAWTTDDGTVVPDLDAATDVIFTGTSAGAKGAIQNADWFLGVLAAPTKRLVIDANMDMTDDVLIGNDIWVNTNANGLGDTPYYSHRITMATASWSSGWNAAVDAFVNESCRAVYEPIGRLDRCSYFGTLLTLMYGGVPFIETETFVRVNLEDSVIDDQWIAPWPTGEQLMVGRTGRYTTKDDFTDLMRQSLEQVFDDTGNNVTAVFGPRCRQHVGLESTGVYTSQTTPDSTDDPALGWVSVGAAISLNDAIWDWYSSAGVLYRTLDTGDVGDPTLANHPVTDPVVQFSAGPRCLY